MASFVVLAVEDETGAQETLQDVERLQKQNFITIDDAATAICHVGGKVIHALLSKDEGARLKEVFAKE